MKHYCLLSILLILAISHFTFAQTNSSIPVGSLTIVISGLRDDEGSVSIAIFNQESAFPKQSEKAVKLIYSKIINKKSITVIENLPAGEYAISVYHDENNNKKMDTNFFGIPNEGIGASNNAKGHFGPPKYSDARFIFGGKSETIGINITYL